MPDIDREELRKTASLAYLAVPEEELEALAAELTEMVGFVDTIRQFPWENSVENAEPIPFDREDFTVTSLDREEFLPSTRAKEGFFCLARAMKGRS